MSSGDGRKTSAAFGQAEFDSGSYAPSGGAFGSTSQTPTGALFSDTQAAPHLTPGGANCGVETSTATPMLLQSTPPRPLFLPAAPRVLDAAASDASRMLFAPRSDQQQHQSATGANPTRPPQLQQQQQQWFGGIGAPQQAAGGAINGNVAAIRGTSTENMIPIKSGVNAGGPEAFVGADGAGGLAAFLPPQQQHHPQPFSHAAGTGVPQPPVTVTGLAGFTFNGGGGDGGGSSNGGGGAAHKLEGPAIVPGYSTMAPQQLQVAAPVYTTPLPPQQQHMIAAMQKPGMTASALVPEAGAASAPFPEQSFLQLNPLYPGLRRLWEAMPAPLYAVDDFFTRPECDALMALASNYMIASPVVGPGAGEVSESRTSSSCFLAREDLPTVCRKVMALTGKPIEHLELPQVGRYYTSQKYANHWDAFDLTTEDGRRFAQNGGQRVCTVLVYLNDVATGGCTAFPQLGLKVQPKKGMAVVFFPATLDGVLDSRLLHAAEPAVDTKWVSQIWIRQGPYSGTPTARIPQI